MKTPVQDTSTVSAPLLPAARRRGIWVMLLSVSAFSANTLLLRYLSGTSKGMPPEVPLHFRAVVGIVIVLLVVRGRRPTQIPPVFTEKKLILRGLTGLLGTAAYYWTVPKLGAGMATLICNTYVIFASLIAVIALGEKLTRTRFAWLAAAFAGIVLLIGRGSGGMSFSLGWYEVIAIAGAVLAASSVILVRSLAAEHSNGTIYLSQCVWILLPVGVMAVPQLFDLSGEDWLLLILSGGLAGAGQLFMNEGYRCLPVSMGASIQMMWPVTTVAGGVLLFGETFSGLQILGACLVLVSVWQISLSGSSPKPK